MQRHIMATKQTDKSRERTIEIITRLGFDGARVVLEALEAGKSVTEIQPLMTPFVRRYVQMSARKRGAREREVRACAAHLK